MKKFRQAIVRRPCPQITNGLTSAKLGKPNYHNALKQHDSYINALQKCGLEVIVLDEDPNYPDSVFVEDTAVCTNQFAIISNPGAKERNGEAIIMKPTLQRFFNQTIKITDNGTLDGGDIMQVDDTFYIGLSKRTNKEGANQFIQIVNKYGMEGIEVSMKETNNIKTGHS